MISLNNNQSYQQPQHNQNVNYGNRRPHYEKRNSRKREIDWDICWDFLSPKGCNRDGCKWRHAQATIDPSRIAKRRRKYLDRGRIDRERDRNHERTVTLIGGPNNNVIPPPPPPYHRPSPPEYAQQTNMAATSAMQYNPQHAPYPYPTLQYAQPPQPTSENNPYMSYYPPPPAAQAQQKQAQNKTATANVNTNTQAQNPNAPVTNITQPTMDNYPPHVQGYGYSSYYPPYGMYGAPYAGYPPMAPGYPYYQQYGGYQPHLPSQMGRKKPNPNKKKKYKKQRKKFKPKMSNAQTIAESKKEKKTETTETIEVESAKEIPEVFTEPNVNNEINDDSEDCDLDINNDTNAVNKDITEAAIIVSPVNIDSMLPSTESM